MKKLLFLLIIISAISCRNSKRGNGHIISETRNLAPFSSVNASNSIDVELQQGDKCEVMVEADDNLLKYVETTSSNGELKVRLKNNTRIRNGSIRVKVISPEFNNIKSSASASITSHNTLSSTNTISFYASSSADIEVQLDAPNVKIDASSSGTINLTGRTKQLTTASSSSSTLNLYDLKAESVVAEVSSSGTINLFASVSLDAKASSSGTINYKGGATNVQKKESSSGSINSN